MSANRIALPPNCFLIYAEILYYCVHFGSNKEHKAFEDLKIELSQKVNQGLASDRNKYLSNLMGNVKKQNKLKCLYGKIATDVKKDNKKIIVFNYKSEIAESFKYLEEVYPNEAKEGINKFVLNYLDGQIMQIIKNEGRISNTLEIKENTSLLDALSDTTWYLYYHEYDNYPKTRLTIISRLILEIVNPGQVFLYEKKHALDFIGSIDLSSSTNSIIVINLETKNSKLAIKKLQLRVIIQEGVLDNSIFLGQYMDFETGNKIVSGTIVLENVKGHLLDDSASDDYNDEYTIVREIKLRTGIALKAIRIDLVYYTGWERYIPLYIAHFLSDKWKNHTKIKPIVSDYESLGNFFKDQKGKHDKYNSKIDFDIFLVTPIGIINEIDTKPYYKEINEYFFKYPSPPDYDEKDKKSLLPIYEACDFLKKAKINKIFYTPRVVKLQDPSFVSDGDSETIIENDISAMKSSRIVVFILPKLEIMNTSFFIKIGWAMQLDKSIIIFPLAANLLPRLIAKPHIGKNLWVSEPIEIKDIPGRIRNDFSKILHI